MIADAEQGLVDTVIVKDLSRLGRNYLVTGQYTELIFPSYDVRFIAIRDNVDSDEGLSDLLPFSNLINVHPITIRKAIITMGFLSKLFGSNKKASKPTPTPPPTIAGSQRYVSQTPVQTPQVTKPKSESEFDFYTNKDPILNIKHLKEVFPIYHRLEEGRWPFLATNGVVDVFSFEDTATEECDSVERNIFVRGMTQSEFLEALRSWYRDGITKLKLDGENGSELLISDILDDPSYPKREFLGSKINRTIILYKQLDEDNQGFLTNIIRSGLHDDLPKNVFLTPILSDITDSLILPCTDLANDLMSEIGKSTFWGSEAYTITPQDALKLEDIKLFDINDDTKKVIFIFTNMDDIKQLFGGPCQGGGSGLRKRYVPSY